MTTALAERPTADVALPKEQIELIRKTVASGATDTELQLFLYDCQRRGIHPLDRLLHFTKRGGKYTPVTSIDFMRSQAAMSGEMAGSDDATFGVSSGDEAHPPSATVTVYRLTNGQRFAYTATARWSEYCPDNAQMWKRMPHTMLAKCAEALALRKAFPQQLAGLYAKEELDQADRESTYIVEAPKDRVAELEDARATKEARAHVGGSQPEFVGSTPTPVTTPEVDHGADLPEGVVMITRVRGPMGKSKGFVFHSHMDPHKGLGEGLAMYDDKLAAFAEQCCQQLTPVRLTTKTSAAGKTYLTAITAVNLTSEEPF